MLLRLLKKLKAALVIVDVPVEQAACMDCNVCACAEARYRTCAYRLNRVAKGEANANIKS